MRILWTVNYLPKEIVNSVFPLFSTHSGGNSQWLRGKQPTWRDVAISEYDYSVTPLSKVTGVDDKNARLCKHLAVWGRRMSQWITRSSTDIQYMRGQSMRREILPFLEDGSEVPPEFTEQYRGPAPQDFLPD